MSKLELDFQQGGALTGDDGERGNAAAGVAAIKPYADGEAAVATVLDRPPENLRQRTETLRAALEDERYVADSAVPWAFTQGFADGVGVAAPIPTINAWNPTTGAFTITDALVLAPLNTPNGDVKETAVYAFPTGVGAGSISIASLFRAAALGNIRRIVFDDVPTASIVAGVPGQCDAAVSGDQGHILTLTYRDDGLTTISNFTTLFALPAYIALLNAAGFNAITAGVAGTFVTAADFLPGGSLPPDYTFSGNAERELHYLTPAVVAAWFAVPANALIDGDTLAVFFNYLTDPTGGLTGRRDRSPSVAVPGTAITAGELFLTSAEPEKIPGCVPICKRVGDDLVFADGTVTTPTIPGTGPAVPVYFGEHGRTIQRILDYATSLANPLAPGGASLIGVATTAIGGPSLGTYDVPGPGDTLDDVIDGILTLLNKKASLDLGAA